ncbi:uncharacterized protein LOC131953844 isoform X2 [Physella acuta]|uniref:uncharacterized protein LOC131953844 isoform X2 n=1 Tax=Physella acuta TaxID=109671 RepID=UPI0027DB2EB2|nr:uncharacterized protein LOC131953844 isoform X2 [Physella acuta]
MLTLTLLTVVALGLVGARPADKETKNLDLSQILQQFQYPVLSRKNVNLTQILQQFQPQLVLSRKNLDWSQIQQTISQIYSKRNIDWLSLLNSGINILRKNVNLTQIPQQFQPQLNVSRKNVNLTQIPQQFQPQLNVSRKNVNLTQILQQFQYPVLSRRGLLDYLTPEQISLLGIVSKRNIDWSVLLQPQLLASKRKIDWSVLLKPELLASKRNIDWSVLLQPELLASKRNIDWSVLLKPELLASKRNVDWSELQQPELLYSNPVTLTPAQLQQIEQIQHSLVYSKRATIWDIVNEINSHYTPEELQNLQQHVLLLKRGVNWPNRTL